MERTWSNCRQAFATNKNFVQLLNLDLNLYINFHLGNIAVKKWVYRIYAQLPWFSKLSKSILISYCWMWVRCIVYKSMLGDSVNIIMTAPCKKALIFQLWLGKIKPIMGMRGQLVEFLIHSKVNDSPKGFVTSLWKSQAL